MKNKLNNKTSQPNYIIKNMKLIKILHFDFCLLKKKSFIYGKYKASTVKYPLFHRRVIIFRLRGTCIKKHYSKHSMNQTITLECTVSKNKFLLTAPTNPKGLCIY
jgi:hypothetical protein